MNNRAAEAMKEFLEALGLDLTALGMADTPRRVATMYEELFSGLKTRPKDIWGEIYRVAGGNNSLVAVGRIPFYSLCEHHLLPFFGEVHIAYLPADGRVAGFGKFVKLVETLAKRPQLQERLTEEIAQEVSDGLGAAGVLAVTEARQLCMVMRGEGGASTLTCASALRGRLAADVALLEQAWRLLRLERLHETNI